MQAAKQPWWLVQGAAIYINIAAPCTTEIHTENQHLTLLVKPRVQPRFLHHLLILCFSCNPVIPKNKKSPKHFPFSVKIPIFASVPRAERSNAAKPAQLPNRYRLPNFLLFKSYLPTDYKKTIVFLKKTNTQVADINLPDYLAQGRNSTEQQYSEQEFLDREYVFKLDFFLKGDTWDYVNLSISVLSWSVRIQNINL